MHVLFIELRATNVALHTFLFGPSRAQKNTILKFNTKVAYFHLFFRFFHSFAFLGVCCCFNRIFIENFLMFSYTLSVYFVSRCVDPRVTFEIECKTKWEYRVR